MPTSSNSPTKNTAALAVCIVVTFLAPTLGAWAMPGEWYASLTKPSWNPPSWIFGPMWTALYLMMATAAWLVWRRGGWAGQRGTLSLYLVQLALNAAWTPLFFGLKMPGPAFAEILLLLAAIVATALAFRGVSKVAAALLLPYIAWVAFASFLNFTLWRLNATKPSAPWTAPALSLHPPLRSDLSVSTAFRISQQDGPQKFLRKLSHCCPRLNGSFVVTLNGTLIQSAVPNI